MSFAVMNRPLIQAPHFALKIVWMTLGSLCAQNFEATAQQQFMTDAVAMKLPDGQAFVEVQTSWSSDAFHDDVTCTILAIQGGEIVSFAKNILTSQKLDADGSDVMNLHIDRLAVEPGGLSLEWEIKHNEDVLLTHHLHKQIPVDGIPAFSEPIVASAFAKATETSQESFVHSGLEILPLVGKRIPMDVSSCMMYIELYNVDDVVGAGNPIELEYGWSDASGAFLPYASLRNQAVASRVVPILETFPCSSDQPDRQAPYVTFQAKTSSGQVIVSNTFSLGIVDPEEMMANVNQPNATQAPLPSLLMLERDAEGWARHVSDHLALATATEQFTMENVLIPNGDPGQMIQYLTGFWMNRTGDFAQAEARHADFLTRIQHVDEAYGACRKGQGSLTEMGNIYLRFGPPNTVVMRHHETDYYPYEIWHYHRAGRFTNKRFLFYAPHVVGECFELLHSDMLGERQNEDWLAQLRSRENRLRVSESMENRLNPRDAFSREEPEDLFYNPR